MNTQTTRNGHQVMRVRDKAGHHITIRADGLNTEKYAPLDSDEFDAVDRNGYPLPPKYRVAKARRADTTATTATNQGQEGGQPS